MKKFILSMVLIVCACCIFAQNYSTVQITPQNNILVVNGIDQISIPNYDPSEVQLEPLAGSVAVPSSDQMYTTAEFATLDAVWSACQSSAVWSTNLVTLDTYSSGGLTTGYVALKFSGTPNQFGYAKFDKSVSGGWTEFGYFTTGSGVDSHGNDLSVWPNPVADVLVLDNIGMAQITICNLNGQIVKNIGNVDGNEAINVADLASGIYIVRVAGNSKVSSIKFVKE